MYNEKYLKTKTKVLQWQGKRTFHDNGVPKTGSNCTYLSVILIDSVSKMKWNKLKYIQQYPT